MLRPEICSSGSLTQAQMNHTPNGVCGVMSHPVNVCNKSRRFLQIQELYSDLRWNYDTNPRVENSQLIVQENTT